MDDLTIAFAMRCDDQGLSYEEGIEAAARLAEEIEFAAADRPSPATQEEERNR